MTYSTLGWDVEGGILRLTLNRPEKMDAFTVEMCDELVDAYGQASAGGKGGRAVLEKWPPPFYPWDRPR